MRIKIKNTILCDNMMLHSILERGRFLLFIIFIFDLHRSVIFLVFRVRGQGPMQLGIKVPEMLDLVKIYKFIHTDDTQHQSYVTWKWGLGTWFPRKF